MSAVRHTEESLGLVSVIMNCYNGSRYLKEAINSILAQSYEKFEIIFWDNRSTDDSASIAKELGDSRIRYFLAEKHTSLGEARMRALSKARGEFIAFLDCDDEWFPNKLEIQIRLMRSNEFGFCYAGNITVDEFGRVLGKFVPLKNQGNLFSSLVKFFNIDMVTPLIRHRVIRELGITFNPNICAAEEVNLFLRLAPHSIGAAIPEALGKSRYLKSSLTRRAGSFLYRDMDITVSQLRGENALIDQIYPEEMRYLEFKSLYLKVKWLMMEGQYSQAKSEFSAGQFNDLKIYRFLRILVGLPALWKILHLFNERFVAIRSKPLLRKVLYN